MEGSLFPCHLSKQNGCYSVQSHTVHLLAVAVAMIYVSLLNWQVRSLSADPWFCGVCQECSRSGLGLELVDKVHQTLANNRGATGAQLTGYALQNMTHGMCFLILYQFFNAEPKFGFRLLKNNLIYNHKRWGFSLKICISDSYNEEKTMKDL